MSQSTKRLAFLLAASFTVSACGGGGGDGRTAVNSASAPPPAAPPVAAPKITIFENPEPTTYAGAGASISGSGGNLDTYEEADFSFGTISTDAAQQAQIRYLADGTYEVKMPGQEWDKLVPYKGIGNPDASSNNYFQPAGVEQNHGYVVIGNSRTKGYSYSELGWWGSEAAGRYGVLAFGVPTAGNAVPVSGMASFSGSVEGNANIGQAHHLYGGYVPLGITGTVQVSLDFGAGQLSGSMSLMLSDGQKSADLGTFAFKDTAFSRSSASYSGKFDTSEIGQNFLIGQLFGPTASETGGGWALPFRFVQTGLSVSPTGQTHQAFGGFLAKRP